MEKTMPNRLTDERFYADIRCDDCGGELSQCGSIGEDGEPELDCRVCQLVNEVERLKQEIEQLREPNWQHHEGISREALQKLIDD